ncbi:hypothetical protein EHRUM1_03610 [Ehrlichia ruminantium]|nr:hypothetical protein EHRUM1_03610 [Ehrlichia ruminantium]
MCNIFKNCINDIINVFYHIYKVLSYYKFVYVVEIVFLLTIVLYKILRIQLLSITLNIN